MGYECDSGSICTYLWEKRVLLGKSAHDCTQSFEAQHAQGT